MELCKFARAGQPRSHITVEIQFLINRSRADDNINPRERSAPG